MSTEVMFYVSLVRLISYIIVLITSVLSIVKRRRNKILFWGDAVFVTMSITSYFMTTIFKVNSSVATALIFTPAFFIWALTRIADFFNVRNFLKEDGTAEIKSS